MGQLDEGSVLGVGFFQHILAVRLNGALAYVELLRNSARRKTFRDEA